MSIEQHPEIVQKVAAGATYTVSGGLIVGDWLQILNDNAGAIGVLIAGLTFAMNWYYRHREFKRSCTTDSSPPH